MSKNLPIIFYDGTNQLVNALRTKIEMKCNDLQRLLDTHIKIYIPFHSVGRVAAVELSWTSYEPTTWNNKLKMGKEWEKWN